VLVAALNALWVAGVMWPRVTELEGEVEAARAAEREAGRDNALLEARLETLDEVVAYSARYRIPADLAQAIFDIALAEDLEPELAFRLVQTESSFRRRAVSEAGAIGYTQILPSTARWLEPGVRDRDLFQRDTNLRLGFRYLRMLLEENGGEMRLALLAYNRGPGTVRAIVARGGDPANGYAARIMGSE
jgi:soluble lytic murein transglycosylase-like protein